MSSFVLVHGAWHGGWAWRRVEPLLRNAGHEVHAPTLTGVSDRAHLLHPGVGLSTHVTDVVALVEAHDLNDVVLVGHSYGGQVITGVADAIPGRIAKRIYLDAFVGGHGEAAVELQPSEVAGHYRHSVEEQGFGWLIPVRSLAKMGVTDSADVEWLTPRLTPHPWLSFTEKLSLTDVVSSVPAEFIECVDWMRVFQGMRSRAEARGWPVHELSTGHEAMVTAPSELATLLAKIASAQLTGFEVDPAYLAGDFQEITAVARPHRGHGLGLPLKTAMLEWLAVAEPGLATIETGGAAVNQPMISINEQLGFEAVRLWRYNLQVHTLHGRPSS